MDSTSLADQIRERRSRLGYRIHFEDVDAKLRGIWNWMREDRSVQQVVSNLKASRDGEELLEEATWSRPPQAATDEQTASVGICLLERCADGAKLFVLASDNGIRPPYQSSKIQDTIDAVVDRFIDPALTLIADRLEATPVAPSAEDILVQRFGLIVSAGFRMRYPETAHQLDATARMFGKHQNDGEWPNVGNSCRQALQSFTQEWREHVEVPTDEAVKAGDVKEIIRAAYRHLYKRGRFRRSLLAVLEGVWDHAQSVVHRESTTKAEAERLFVWVCLTLLELDRAVG